MSLTNLCSCALMKDHIMRQVINNRYLTILRIMNLASFFKNKYFDLFFLKNLSLYPFPPPPLYSVSPLMKTALFVGGGGGILGIQLESGIHPRFCS